MANEIISHLQENWEEVLRPLPEKVIEESAREKKALLRMRAIKDGRTLLRLTLMYALLQSLRLTTLLAASMELCDISAQALQERMHKSEAWLEYLIQHLLSRMMPEQSQTIAKEVARIVLVDGTMIARPGSEGTEWRLHVAWDPMHLQASDIAVTGPEQGEGFEQVQLQPRDLVIADRGYGAWRHILVALVKGAFFLIRIPWTTLRLQTAEGQPFDLIKWLKRIPAEDGVVQEVTVTLADDPQQRVFRVVAGRIPQEKVTKAKAKVRKQAKKKRREPHPHTLLAAEFCIVITNLPATVSATTVLELYSIRWQIEWSFRRWKSLWELDNLPSRPAKIAYPVLLAKILIVLLLQQQIAPAVRTLWMQKGKTPPAISRLARLGYLAFFYTLIPPNALYRILKNPLAFTRHLRLSKRKRPSQLDNLKALSTKLSSLLPLT